MHCKVNVKVFRKNLLKGLEDRSLEFEKYVIERNSKAKNVDKLKSLDDWAEELAYFLKRQKSEAD